MKPRARYWTIGIGAALVVASVGFRTLAIPSIVRFPLNVDETAHYAGTAITYVDPTTAAPLAQPLRQPLTLDRRIRVVSGSATKAVITETITAAFGDTKTVEEYQYVLDRRSMTLVDDPRQYAFGSPASTIHANGAYRVNWPMGTKVKSGYLSYIVEADATAPLTLVEGTHFHQNAGVSVIDFSSTLTHEVAPYYLANLKRQGLPMELTAAQIAPQLQAAGVNITKALADVAPHLTAAEGQVLAATLSTPIPLKYFWVVDGDISVEPHTGMLMNVHSNHEGLGVEPDLSGAAGLQGLLTKYASIPSVKAASDGLAKLATQPPSLVEDLQYTQTDASAAHMGSKARSQIRQLNLVEFRLPWGVGALGMALVLLAVALSFRRHPPTPTAIPLPAEPEAVRPAA